MSPFLHNLQRFLIIIFTAIPVVLITIGVMRANKNENLALNQDGLGNITPGTSASQASTAGTAFVGKIIATPYGETEATIKVASGKIVAVTMSKIPNSPPSIYAEPYLVQQALAVGSANIQGVSGATYTSLAFKASLENAIAQAGSQGQSISPNTGATITTPKPIVPKKYRDDDDDDEWDD